MTVRFTATSTLAALSLAVPAFAVPPNDLRGNAVSVTVGNSYSGTTASATNSNDTAGACGGAALRPMCGTGSTRPQRPL
ncbi:MAG: hypothetical protein QM783_08005 [Phycisphaerales bacterium]